MLTWIKYIFRPIFVEYLETCAYYLIVDGLGSGFSVSKFVTSRSRISAISKKLSDLNNKLKIFFQILHVKGIGFKVYYYRVTHSLYFNLGYNHVCKYLLNLTISVKVRKQYLLLFVKLFSPMYFINEIRNLRFPDPYRGKGIRFRFQEIKFKPGKQR